MSAVRRAELAASLKAPALRSSSQIPQTGRVEPDVCIFSKDDVYPLRSRLLACAQATVNLSLIGLDRCTWFRLFDYLVQSATPVLPTYARTPV